MSTISGLTGQHSTLFNFLWMSLHVESIESMVFMEVQFFSGLCVQSMDELTCLGVPGVNICCLALDDSQILPSAMLM